jgi:hypothetical protein
VAELLGSKNIDLVLANEIDEPIGIGSSPQQISRQNANRPRQALLPYTVYRRAFPN